ncbi:MAG: class I SAM-dependent rRNA methyltransferase [Nitrospinota bacterium]
MSSTVRLKKDRDKRIRSGHLWVFSNEIADSLKRYEAGGIVDVFSYKGEFLARGYINPSSLITIRILTYEREEINTEFFYNRITKAWSYRKKIYPDINSCRIVFGESDFLPGLVIDKYEDYLAVQTLSLGMDKRLDTVLDVLEDIFHPAGIIERNDVAVRKLEGIEEKRGILRGNLPSLPLLNKDGKGGVVISEGGLKFEVDILKGQKTGFFFDQRDNRQGIKKYIRKGMRVLDCFCYSGAWSMYAAEGGAGEVIGIDSSKDAVKWAMGNAEINRFSDICRFKNGDVFYELRRLVSSGEEFDMIILDPPAFVKSSARVKEGLKGYKEINLQAMKLLKDDGMLITCSCSYHIDRVTFRDILIQSASDSQQDFRIIEFRGQSLDHPVLLSMSETEYLRCAFLQRM